MRAIMETGSPISFSPRNPPVNARGTVKRMMKGLKRLWNCATIIRYTSISERAMTSAICSII